MSVEVLDSVVEPLEGVRPVCEEVVVMVPRPELVYSHSLLLELKNHPLAKVWPPYLDPAFKNSRGVWDPDRWHLDRKRGETPPQFEERRGIIKRLTVNNKDLS